MEALAQLDAVTEWKASLAGAYKLGQFENGGVMAKLQEFAESHSVPVGTVRAQYYKYKNLGIPPEVEAEIVAEVDDQAGNSSPTYEVGTDIEVKVTALESYGVKIVTTDGYGILGLIHISELAAAYVTDVADYAKVGELLTARILKFDEEKSRLNLSLRQKPKALVRRVEQEAPSIQNETPTTTEQAKPSEFDLICNHLSSKVGELTPSAKEMFREIVQEHGAFAVGMAVGSVDLGELLAKAIGEQMGRSL